MNKGIRLGPLALLLTIISVCMTTLAVLTYSTAKADLRLAQHYADGIQVQYQRESQGQEFLAEAQDIVASGLSLKDLEGVSVDGDTVSKDISVDDSGILHIVLRENAGTVEVLEWQTQVEWEPETEINGLWGG